MQFLFIFTSLKTIQIIILYEACNRRAFRNSVIYPQFSFKELIKIVSPQFEFREKFLAGLSFAAPLHRRISNSSYLRRPT